MELNPAFSSTSGSFCSGVCIPASVVLLLHIYLTIIKVHMVRNLVILNIIQQSLLKSPYSDFNYLDFIFVCKCCTLKSARFSSLSTSPGLNSFKKFCKLLKQMK